MTCFHDYASKYITKPLFYVWLHHVGAYFCYGTGPTTIACPLKRTGCLHCEFYNLNTRQSTPICTHPTDCKYPDYPSR